MREGVIREREREERECHMEDRERWVLKKSDFLQNYDFALFSILIVFYSIQLGFEPTTCLRTHFDVIYAVVQLKFPNSFPVKKSTLNLINYLRGKIVFYLNKLIIKNYLRFGLLQNVYNVFSKQRT